MSTRLRLITATGLFGLLPFSIVPTDPSPTPGSTASACMDDTACTEACPSAQDSQGKGKRRGKLDPDSAEACAECHKTIHTEWRAAGQLHAEAWTDKIYQDKIKKKKRAKSCYGCHIPERVLARISNGKTRKPKTRKKLLHEGVGCVSCHEGGGKMHGPFGAKTKAHGTVKDPLFTPKGSNLLCLSCHKTKIDVVLPIGKDFVNSGLEAKGKSCIGCHMAEVNRPIANVKGSDKPDGPRRKGRSHKILGAFDAEFCATAFKLSVKRGGGKTVLTVANEAGHNVPGLLIRSFHFLVNQLDANGKILAKDKFVVDSENVLEVLKSLEFQLKNANAAVGVEIVIQHHFMDKLVADIKKTKLKL